MIATMYVEKVVREYIEKSPHMSLATVSGDRPWVCEVHFAYDKQLNLYFRSLPTRRHSKEIAKNPRVAGNIVGQHALSDYPHAIYFEGKAALLTSDKEREEAFPYFFTRLGLPETALEDARKPGGYQFYKITVTNWYAFGRFGHSFSEKYQLKWAESKKTAT